MRLDRTAFVWAGFPSWLLSDWRCGDWGDAWLLIPSLWWAVPTTFHLLCPLGYSFSTSVRQLGKNLFSAKLWWFFACFLCAGGEVFICKMTSQISKQTWSTDGWILTCKAYASLTPHAKVLKYALPKIFESKHNVMWKTTNGLYLVHFCYIDKYMYVPGTACCEENVIRRFLTVWECFIQFSESALVSNDIQVSTSVPAVWIPETSCRYVVCISGNDIFCFTVCFFRLLGSLSVLGFQFVIPQPSIEHRKVSITNQIFRFCILKGKCRKH